MPCYGPSAAEIREEEIRYNKNTYGIEATNEGLNREMACQALRALESRGLLVALPEHVRVWWTIHKERDRIRQEREAQLVEDKKAAASGLAKLTPKERKALGL